MLTSPSPYAQAERTMILRVAIALGLALLLLVGAWSTSHGQADVHTSLCVAPAGAAPTAGAADTPAAAPTAIDVLSSGAAACAIAVLCGVMLVLLLRRLLRGPHRTPLGIAPYTAAPVRAGPAAALPGSLSLVQLSISRT